MSRFVHSLSTGKGFALLQRLQGDIQTVCFAVFYCGTGFIRIGIFCVMQNEMAYLEFIHNLVETMDKYFENVCELDIMYNIEKAHYILDEMIMNGQIV